MLHLMRIFQIFGSRLLPMLTSSLFSEIFLIHIKMNSKVALFCKLQCGKTIKLSHAELVRTEYQIYLLFSRKAFCLSLNVVFC